MGTLTLTKGKSLGTYSTSSMLNTNSHRFVWGISTKFLKASKKWGGLERPQQQMEGFRHVVHACSFQDMGFEGLEFRWSNQRSKGERIRLRLDRVLATTKWKEKYQYAKVLHVVDSTSDHCALILTN